MLGPRDPYPVIIFMIQSTFLPFPTKCTCYAKLMIMILAMDVKSSSGRDSLYFKKISESASTIPA